MREGYKVRRRIRVSIQAYWDYLTPPSSIQEEVIRNNDDRLLRKAAHDLEKEFEALLYSRYRKKRREV